LERSLARGGPLPIADCARFGNRLAPAVAWIIRGVHAKQADALAIASDCVAIRDGAACKRGRGGNEYQRHQMILSSKEWDGG